ncbi:hydrolase [Streptomyces sp. NPDC048442]|uniref:hydrolase n=1 Tax=Streptomyces sp. NPDC048442 TaxID=3154823 RepID=UPI00341FC93C
MSLWTSLEPTSATVDPGSSTRVRLRVRNTGDVVDEYRFEPVGALAPWTLVEPPSLRLYPGTTGTVELTFSPPRTPDATAGPNPYAVRIIPTEHPDAVTVPEGNLTILPFSEMRTELVPPTVRGRLRGRPRLAVDNLGNTKLTASISGSDNGDHLSYEIRPGSAQIEPGRAQFVDMTLRPKQIIWFGSKEQRPYTLSVQRSGVSPESVEGTYVQRGFLPRWLATFLGVAVALAITFVMLWIAYKPSLVSAAAEKPVPAGAIAPSPSAPPLPKPSVPADPPPPAQDPKPGGDGGKPEKEKPDAPKPPPKETAQTAVRRIASDDPGGRHICYRVRITDGGWQKPVCDGTLAGTTGQGKKIIEMNIAVSGVEAASANGLLHDPESNDGKPKWAPDWTPLLESKDIYIGGKKPDSPFLVGLGINVGKGKVCHEVHFRNNKWGDHICSEQRPNYLFIGTLDNGAWIDAIKLTV